MKKRNEIKLNKIKHTKNEIRASKDSSQSEPDPRFLTCEEEVTPVWLPHAAHDARCARSTWQGLSSQTQPQCLRRVVMTSRRELMEPKGCAADMQETPAPLRVPVEAFGRQD